jgi:hypothetical protein
MGHLFSIVNCSVADPGCLYRIRIFFIPPSASKNLHILTQKIVSRLFIPDPDQDPGFLPTQDSRVKKAPDPGSGSTTLVCYQLVDVELCLGSYSLAAAEEFC